MKNYTNHSQGMRGIRVFASKAKDPSDTKVVWLDPGKSAKLDPEMLVGDLPDLGKPGDAPANDAADDLTAQVADLSAQVDALTKERDELKAQVAKFDPDGDGRPGGSKPAPK
jgi:hypothetical protein